MKRQLGALLVSLAALTLAACDGEGCFVASGCDNRSGGGGSGGGNNSGGSVPVATGAIVGYYTGKRIVPTEGTTQDVIVLAAENLALALVEATGQVDIIRPGYTGLTVTGTATARPRDDGTLPNGNSQDSGTVGGLLRSSGFIAELLLDYIDLSDARLEITRNNNLSTGIGASFSRLAGRFAGIWNTGDPLSFTVDGNGAISGTSSAGCQYGGTFEPALSLNYNLYDLQLNSTCASTGRRTGLASLLPADTRNPQDRLFLITTGETGYRAATITRTRQLPGGG